MGAPCGLLTMPILSLSKVSFRYPEQKRSALTEVSLDIQKGEFLAILGGDGSGKSTLCKTLNGLIPHHVKGVFSGDVLLEGRSTRSTPVTEIATQVALSLQDPEMQLFTDSVEEEAAFAPENLALPWAEIDARVKRALHVTGLSSLREKSPSALSGGQKQRLAIASVVSMLPSVLVLDEPLSMLDPRGRQELLVMLDSLRRERQITVIISSNTAEEIASHCDRIALLDRGRLLGVGSPAEMLTSSERLLEIGVEPPQLLELSERLVASGFLREDQKFIGEERGAEQLLSSLSKRGARP